MKEFLEKYGELFQANSKSYRKFLEAVTDIVANVALYVTLALAAALIVWSVVIRNRDEQQLAAARKTMTGIVTGYAVGVITVLGSFRFYAEIMAGNVTWQLWLIVGLIALVAVGVAVTLFLQKKNIQCFKWVALGFVIAFLAYVIVILCVVQPEESYVPLSNWQMYLFSAILVGVIVTLALVGGNSTEYNTKALTYAAICIATSFALSYVKFFSMPQGGSVTFASMLPLAIYSYMFGTRKGVIAGVVYGLLQFVQNPQFYQPMQVLLDYPIAFGAIGVAGIGRKMKFLRSNVHAEFAVGTTVAVLLRYVSHVMSGYYVFYTWAGNNHPLVYSLAYNTYTMVDLGIVLVIGVIALSSKSLKRIILTANSESN